jgi:four helix bundle protein
MESHQFSFEKLEVWQSARLLAKNIYIVARSFPSDEKYALTQQLRRAALSVCANLAEGTTRISAKDQAHFTTISYSSMMELLNHLIIAFDLAYISEEELKNFRAQIQPLSVKLSNLKKSQLSRIGGLKTIFLLVFSYSLSQPLQPLNF